MKKRRKWLAISACALMLSACVAPLVHYEKGAAADQAVWNGIVGEGQYVLDDVLEIPASSVTFGGNTYNATLKVQYPDGSVQSVGDSLTFSRAGKYTLIYEAAGIVNKVPVTVADKLWRVSNPKSTITYGKVGKTSGLKVGLSRGDVLTFNKVIDVSTLASDQSIIEGFINPSIVGVYEFERLSFTFTDVQDPTQTLTIVGTRSHSSDDGRFAMSYWTAAGKDQTQGGFNGANFSSSESEMGLRGTAIQSSFFSKGGVWKLKDPNDSSKGAYIELIDITADEAPFKIYFNSENKEVSVNAKRVADLDEPSCYEKEPLWSGFPSGKVTLKVEAQELVGETANFCISKLATYDFTGENQFIETEKPEITVDVEQKYIQVSQDSYSFIPQAVVGGSFGVPDAMAFDNYSGVLPVDVKVYRNYSNPSARIEMPIQDGRFPVNYSGKYAIVYTAMDAMGNSEEKVYWITAVSSLANPLSISLPSLSGEGVCGQTLQLPVPEVEGGSGDSAIKVQAICGNTVIDLTDYSFMPEQAGEWTIRYTATDYAGITKQADYALVVDKGTVPIFAKDPILPKYLVSGLEYTVPNVYAYDYTSGQKQERLASLKLIDSTGTHVYAAGSTYKPVATEANPFITLEFSVGGATLTKVLPAVFPFEERSSDRPPYVHIDKLFVLEGATAVRSSSGLTLTASGNRNSSWEFANPLVANGASVTVKGVKGKSNFDGLKMTFTDSADSNVSVTMYLENGENGYAKIRFGDTEREMTKGFNLGTDKNGNALDNFTFTYKLGKFYVDSVGVNVAVDDNGNAFNGFPSNRIYVSAETVNATNGAQYIVKEMDNHTINSTKVDSTKPRIAINGVYGGMYNANDMYVITSADVSDTIDADIQCFLTVKDPKGNVVCDLKGNYLENISAEYEYEIQLTTYGQYIVEYTATDYFGNVSPETSYSINVFDRVAPQASIEDTWSATAKVGEQVVLPVVNVLDNESSLNEMTIYRFVRNPNGVVTALGYDFKVNKDGSLNYTQYKYTFQYAGDYRFVIVVCDEIGNQTVLQYIVTVQ